MFAFLLPRALAFLVLVSTIATPSPPTPGYLAGGPPMTAATLAGPAREATWSWPTPSHTVLAGFEAPPSRYGAGHRGVDLVAHQGETILAPADGVVAFVGSVAGRGILAIDHGHGYRSSIEPVASMLAVGAIVRREDPVGTVSGSTHCGSECVHSGVRLDGEYVSPLLMWGAALHPRLLPP